MVTMNLIPTLQSTHRRPEFQPLLVISLHNNPQHLCTVDSTSGVSLIILLVIVGSLAHTPTHMFNIMTVFAAPLLVAMFFRTEYSYKTYLSSLHTATNLKLRNLTVLGTTGQSGEKSLKSLGIRFIQYFSGELSLAHNIPAPKERDIFNWVGVWLSL
jgi:hypothetical protein